MLWWVLIPDIVFVIAGLVLIRWLISLQHKSEEHAERISRIEGKSDDT